MSCNPGSLLAERPAEQVRHAGDQPVDVDRLRVERLTAREGQQALGQRSGALGAAMRILRRPLEAGRVAAGGADMALQGLQVAEDDGEQVVEVMGDAAGELADRFHLLGLAQRSFHALALRRLGRQSIVGGFELGGAVDEMSKVPDPGRTSEPVEGLEQAPTSARWRIAIAMRAAGTLPAGAAPNDRVGVVPAIGVRVERSLGPIQIGDGE